jgi:hypothetical protein
VITEPSPIVDPGRTVTRPAIQTSSPMSIGRGRSPSAPSASGTSVSAITEYCPTWERDPMRTRDWALTAVPKLIHTPSPISIRPSGPVASSTGAYGERIQNPPPISMRPALRTIGRPTARAPGPTWSQERR